MRVFVNDGNGWEYNERQVKERGTKKFFTLTQPKRLFAEDYYSVRRAIACENVPSNVVPERDFYVYEFSYMDTGCCMYVVTVDEDTAKELISTHMEEFLHGDACGCIRAFFEERLER